MNKCIEQLNIILTNANVCKSHGINHAVTVMEHSILALESKEYFISNEQKEAVKLAALLHDADDKKFFPEHKNYDNLRFILTDKSSDFVNLVITMVSLVSSSLNADRIPDDAAKNEWMLIPRYADRVEAIGLVGIERCFQYNKTINCSLYTEFTPRAKTVDEIFLIATKERYNNYKGNSVSMIDHYYDKLIRINNILIDNDYLVNLADKRNQVIIKFILWFGEKGTINNEEIEQFIEDERKKS
jgi:uncharacterized protein